MDALVTKNMLNCTVGFQRSGPAQAGRIQKPEVKGRFVEGLKPCHVAAF